MKSMLLKNMLIALLGVLFVTSFAMAEEAAVAANDVIVTGTVEVIRGEGDKISEMLVVDLKTQKEYQVVINETGEKMAKELEGKSVEITGSEEKKGDSILLTVKSYKAVEVKAPAVGAPEEKK